MSAAERLETYARRFNARSGEWPTVRAAARALRLPQGAIEDAAADLPLMLSSFNTEPPEALGDHFVEICE